MSNPAKAEVEAEAKTHATVTYKGHDFTFPLDMLDWSVDAIEAFEEAKGATIVRELVPPAQWREFKATRPTGRDLNAVTDLFAVELGLRNTGESEASSA